MKKTEFLKEISELSVENLQAKAKEIAEELMRLRFRKASGQLDQGHVIPELKKNYARVKTLISQKSQADKGAAAAS